MTNITEYSLQLECVKRKIQSSKDWQGTKHQSWFKLSLSQDVVQNIESTDGRGLLGQNL